MAIKAVAGKLPVNLIVVAEGDEERMSIGLRQFVKTHPELFKDAEALWNDGGQSSSGRSGVSPGDSEGCVYVELTTSGAKWGRGPTVSDIHGGNKRSVDSPAWRHMKMLASLVTDDGNKIKVDGFYDDAVAPSKEKWARGSEQAKFIDMKTAAENLGVARFMADDPVQLLHDRNWISFNLDGIWGGNMYAGGAGAILPNKITSKHNIRYVPNMTGPDLVEKIKKQLVKNGYPDVDVKLIGDVPWRVAKLTGDLPAAQARALDIIQVPYTRPKEIEDDDRRLLAGVPVRRRRSGAACRSRRPASGYGGNAHAANEFYRHRGRGQGVRLRAARRRCRRPCSTTSRDRTDAKPNT